MTEKNVTQIAVDSGFSNLSAFNRVFREMYHMTPSDYRKQTRETLAEQHTQETALKERLKNELEFEILENTSARQPRLLRCRPTCRRASPTARYGA